MTPLRPTPASRFADRLASVAADTALPYGYTLVVWSTGAALIREHGSPAPWKIFLFLLGAIVGYVAVDALAALAAGCPSPSPATQRRVVGAAHLLAVGGAVGAAVLLSLLGGWVAWPLAAFGATVVYQLLAAVELLVADRFGG